jgi:hypothetical protein
MMKMMMMMMMVSFVVIYWAKISNIIVGVDKTFDKETH